ncbi:CD83 antigen [Clarias gariepinus]|uniref:CD83 antigen n=1 Tax=Clarias gariepinus TaxID=13013 RepID=UPI00234E0F73|nr:CD83 antigen [Clarias gariepinus]
MRSNNALSFILLLTFGVGVRSNDSSAVRLTRSNCGEDALLKCSATSKPGVQYRLVIWYKVNYTPSRKLTGLVMKNLTHHNSNLKRYEGVERDLQLLEDSQSLVLPNVTLQDAGTYLCMLFAPVGHQIEEGQIQLTVYDASMDNGTSKEQDTLYLILAIVLLMVALVMLYISYTCLKDTQLSNKNKVSKETSKKIHQIKDTIIKLDSKGIVCTLVPQIEYV